MSGFYLNTQSDGRALCHILISMNYEVFMNIHVEFKMIFNLRLCLFYCSLMEGYIIKLDDEYV